MRWVATVCFIPALLALPLAATEDPVCLARQDLAQRLGIASGDIAVIAREEVTWPDGSLGCPKPGMGYTQALVAGQRLILEAAGRRYHYHAGSDKQFFYCARPGKATGDKNLAI
jgi:hypothetical protein